MRKWKSNNGELQQSEGDFDVHANFHGSAISQRRLEFPLTNSFDGFFIEPEPHRLEDLHVGDVPLSVDDGNHYRYPGVLSLARFLGVTGIRRIDRDRRRHVAADVVSTAP